MTALPISSSGPFVGVLSIVVSVLVGKVGAVVEVFGLKGAHTGLGEDAAIAEPHFPIGHLFCYFG